MKGQVKHAFIYAILSTLLLFVLHHLPINHIFIDPFSEAIKSQDVTDISISKLRDHRKVKFDDRIFIINSEITDRALVAKSVNQLLKHDVSAIGVDLLFDSLNNNYNDTILANSLNNEKIVLGYSFVEHNHGHGHSENSHMEIKDKSAEIFTKECKQGYVNLGTQDGFTVRTFQPEYTDKGKVYNSFSKQLAQMRDKKISNIVNDRKNKIEWINFRRMQPGDVNMKSPINKNEFVHYQMTTMRQFVQDSSLYAPSFFKDKIVLIGFCGENENALSMKDRYYTSLNEHTSGRSIPDMHGVIVHANIISMLLDRDFIDEIPEKVLYLISFLLLFVNYFVFKKILAKKILLEFWAVRLVQIIEFILLLGLCLVLMSAFSIKLGFILIITAVIMSFELFEFYDHKLVNYLKKLFYKSPNQ